MRWRRPSISLIAEHSSSSLRMMPTRFCITCCSSWWTLYGFSPVSLLKGARSSSAARSRSASDTAGRELERPLAYSAA